MGGVKAPKDPERMRPYFYIMKDKEVFGAEETSGEEKGKGISYLYESDGRLKSSAKVAGGVTDEDVLKRLTTAEGFCELVYSIGVSVEAKQEEAVTFVFQMYGKTDPYQSGTIIRRQMCANGVEERILLDEAAWSPDDDVPGQIRFVFDTPNQSARVSVRLFLRDGFRAPKPVEEYPVDRVSAAYREMIARSLISCGRQEEIRAVIEKAKSGGDVTLAYIGGSITQGAGATPIHTKSYAYCSCKAFKERYQNGGRIRLIKAGVGGTPSELGVIRFERDVLRDGKVQPDVIVVEFAVNDEGDETKGVCYESLIRKILLLPYKPVVILLFSVFADDWNLQERLAPVGQHYGLGMVSVRDAVVPQFYFGHGAGRVLSKNQFFYDAFHPTNLGHQIMADCLMHLFAACEPDADSGAPAVEVRLAEQMKRTVYGDTFTGVKLLDRNSTYSGAKIDCGDFSRIDRKLQCVEMDEALTPTPQFPYNWHYDGTKAAGHSAFRIKIACRALILVFKDSGDADVGKAQVCVDKERVLTADPHENGWVHCNPVILFEKEERAVHEVTIKMAEADVGKKFTVLAFGYVE